MAIAPQRYEMFCRRSRLATMRMTAIACAALWTAGCCWGVKSPQVPPDYFTTDPGAELSSTDRPELTYNIALPSVSDLEVHGGLTVKNWLGAGYFGIKVLAQPQAERLLMIGTREPEKVFTLTADAEKIAILIGREGFEGPIPQSGSPLRDMLGVEPIDILKILTLPQRASAGKYDRSKRCGRWRLTPSEDAADGLQWIDIDAATGLPAAACWKREREHWWRSRDTWRVEIARWDRFAVDKSGEPSPLMPADVTVRRNRAGMRLDLHVDNYYFVPPIPDEAFNRPGGTKIVWRPLEYLDEAQGLKP